ncbi:MAG: M48 family metalloprotease [Marinibacterium sp.]|nr:M48 family metalloprotease [Marinibacterium sp.]
MCISHVAAMFFDRVSRVSSIPTLVLAIVLTFWSSVQAAAVGLLRDPDIEHGLTQLASPILNAAGLSPSRVRVLVVNDGGLNAFVIDGQAIFLNYGLILRTETPEMLQGVIAHEAAHIVNGHIARRMANLKSARGAAGLGLALSLLAAAAGAPEAAIGLGLGTQSAAQRSFLAHTRAEESSADQSAARFMVAAGVNPMGLLDTHRLFLGQESLSVGRQDPYMRSHPLTRDRIRAAEAFVSRYGDTTQEDPNAQYWLARVRGKLSAFTRAPGWTLRRLKSERYKDVRLMREAVAHHRNSKLQPALKAIDGAIALRPNDGYYYDLKGQILLENRKVDAAIAAYAKAAKLAPSEPLILGSYGRALLAGERYKEALAALERARARDFRDARILRDLSVAYARTGQPGMASVATAERYALQGRIKDAGLHARRAMGQLPRGSAGWRRAEDVYIAYEQAQKRRK